MYGTIVRSVVSALFFRRVGGTGRETPGHDEISIHTSAQISKSSPQHNCRSILTVPPASEIMVSLRDHLKNHFGFDEFRNRQEDVVQVLQQHIFVVFVVVFDVFCFLLLRGTIHDESVVTLLGHGQLHSHTSHLLSCRL